MNRQTVNDTFSLQIPDSFEPVSAEELHSLSRGSDPYRWGVRDRENRRMILVLWKQYPALLLCCGREETADADQETFRQILGSLQYI